MKLKSIFCGLSLCVAAAQASELRMNSDVMPRFDSMLRRKFALASDLAALFAEAPASDEITPVRKAAMEVALYKVKYEKTSDGWKGSGEGLCKGNTQVNVYDLRQKAEGSMQLIGFDCSTKLNDGSSATIHAYGIVRLVSQDYVGDQNGDRKVFSMILASSNTQWWSLNSSSTDVTNVKLGMEPELNFFSPVTGPATGDEAILGLVNFQDAAN